MSQTISKHPYKVEVKHPFRVLIDTLEENKDKVFYTNKDEGTDFLMNLTGLIKAACYLETTVEEAYSVIELNLRMKREHLPYEVIFKIHSEGDGYTSIPGPECFSFSIKDSDEDNNLTRARDHIERYMRCLSEESAILSYEAQTTLKAITKLYNDAYGPFYTGDPNHVYTVDEINVLMMHRCIPFFIRTFETVETNGHTFPAYSIMECNW